MGKQEDLKQRVENTSGGDEMGGTSFGQSPGEASHDNKRNPDRDGSDRAGKTDDEQDGTDA